MFIIINLFRVTFPLILYLNSFVSNIEETRENEKTLIDNCIEELIKSDGICGDSSFVQKSCSTGSDEINQVKIKKLTYDYLN